MNSSQGSDVEKNRRFDGGQCEFPVRGRNFVRKEKVNSEYILAWGALQLRGEFP